MKNTNGGGGQMINTNRGEQTKPTDRVGGQSKCSNKTLSWDRWTDRPMDRDS